MNEISSESWVALARTFGFVVVVVGFVKLRPWRWVASWLRSGRG